MIPFDFEYYQPETLSEAADAFLTLRVEGKDPVYYGGGTELLTDARLQKIKTGAVIDLKAIPECQTLGRHQGALVFGAGRTLAQVADANLWELLTSAAERVADHTTRCKITLGGNIAGRIYYREAALPFLLVDGVEALVMGPSGPKNHPFDEIFRDGALSLNRGEFLVQLKVPEESARMPGMSQKKTRLDWIDYPLVTVAIAEAKDGVRAAFSGLIDRPFHSQALDHALNGSGGLADRIENALCHIPGTVLDDVHGSPEYRRFIAKNTIEDILQAMA